MEISLNKIDEVNGTLKLKISETDYSEKVEKSMRELRRNVSINGFRKGNVPMGLVKKMYGSSVFADELNKIVSESLYGYISENKLDILGEPLPSEKNEKMDIANQKDFEFNFDIAFRPAIELKLTKRDKVTKYEIVVEEEELTRHKDYYRKRFGEYKATETSDETSLITFDINACDKKGKIIADGLKTEMNPIPFFKFSAKAQEIVKPLKVGETTVMLSADVCTDKKDLYYILHLSEKEADMVPEYLKFEVKEIKNLAPAELNQDFFDAAFGKDTIHSEEEFNERIVSEISKTNASVTEQHLKYDVRKKVMKKVSFDLPDDFLKRWMMFQNQDKKKTFEDIERDYPIFREDLKWHLVYQSIVKSQEFNATDEELQEAARTQARAFYAQYGLPDVKDEYLIDIVEKMLTDEKQKEKLIDNVLEDKVFEHIKESLNIETKKVTFEEYKKLKEKEDEKSE